MTLDEAMAVAVAEVYEHETWTAAEKVFAAHKLCPHCACDGFQVKLGRFQDSTDETYAGRECPSCEGFVPELEQNHYDTDASGMCYSDADPGF